MGFSKSYSLRNEESSERLFQVIEKLSDIVTSTMGPGGKLVVIQAAQGVMATKDGVTVARHIAPRDPFEATVARLIVDAADRTVKEVGDGTTTTVCLVNMLCQIWAHVKNEVKDMNDFLLGMDAAVSQAIKYLEENAKKIVVNGRIDKDVLYHVASIACNGDRTIAGLVSDLIYEIGPKGRVLMKRNLGTNCYTEKLNGYSFNTMLLGRHHLRDKADAIITLEKAHVCIVLDPLENDNDIAPIVDTWLNSPQCRLEGNVLRPLVIITSGLTGTARSFVSGNAERYPIYVILIPQGGQEGFDILSDIKDITLVPHIYSITNGGRTVRDNWGCDFLGDETTESEMWREFGITERIVLSNTQCSIVPIEECRDMSIKIAILDKLIKVSKDEVEIEHLKRRVAALSSGVGIVYVGADSEVEAARVSHSMDDTQRACFAALSDGVVPGAGRGMLKAAGFMEKEMQVKKHLSDKNEDYSYWMGYNLVLTAMCSPAITVFANYQNNTHDEVLDWLYELIVNNEDLAGFWSGWDIKGNVLKDAMASGVIDPLLVAKSSMKNAVSVVKQIISARYVMVEDVLPVMSGAISQDEVLDERIDKNYIKDLYARLEELRINKEKGYGMH